jgi:hypothetical protein
MGQEKRDANSSATVYHYNADLQPTEIDRPDGTNITHAYTSSKLSGLTAPIGTWQFCYSSTTGQLTSIAAPGGGNLNYTYDGLLPTQASWTCAVTGRLG